VSSCLSYGFEFDFHGWYPEDILLGQFRRDNQAVEKSSPAAFCSFLVIAAYFYVRLIPGDLSSHSL